MQNLESRVARKLVANWVDRAKDKDVKIFAYKNEARWSRGFPDYFVLVGGAVYLIEFKVCRNKKFLYNSDTAYDALLTPQQRDMLKKLTEFPSLCVGVIVYHVHSKSYYGYWRKHGQINFTVEKI